MLKPLFNSLLVLLAAASLSGCNSYSSGGLVGDYEETSKCPANGCANQAASDTALKLTTTGNTVSLYPTAADTKVEISGDCHPSTYASNKILVSVVTQNGNTPVTAPVYSATGSSTVPMCRNGKYGVVIDIRNMATSAIYTVKLELVAYDATGTPHTNAGGGSLFLNLVR